jgi:hypothetical protein
MHRVVLHHTKVVDNRAALDRDTVSVATAAAQAMEYYYNRREFSNFRTHQNEKTRQMTKSADDYP